MKRFAVALVAMLCAYAASAQSYSISGVVTNVDSEPLPYVSVYVADTYLGTETNQQGKYRLDNLEPGSYTVVVQHLGLLSDSQTVKLSGPLTLDFKMSDGVISAPPFVIEGIRTTANTPMAKTELDRDAIQKENLGQDLPYMLRLQPSVVVTSDAGAGVGYTGIRIRGSDPTRINVNINGIPLNDAESHGVFWVNMPDLATSTDNIQIQRGVGTSTNGAGAFGGTVNLSTTQLRKKAYAETSNSYGSFNTVKNNVAFGTGLVKDHWTFDARLSRINSDGFVDRASSNLRSYFLSGGYVNGKTSLRANIFSGHEITYQAWWGIPKDSLETNRTYNPANYDNEVDNYTQTHYQLILAHELTNKIKVDAALHYTRGYGYFEQFAADDALANYGLNDVVLGDTTITTSDIIRRRWLDNDFYGATWSLSYRPNNRLQVIWGGGANQYIGRHFGEVIWAEYASNSEIRDRYYDNEAEKNDINTYAKANYQVNSKLNVFADVQYRYVHYLFTGKNVNGFDIDQQVELNFINPKGGLTYNLNNQNSLWASVAVGNKEPNRDDYTETSPESRPEHESLIDYEFGYKRTMKKYAMALTGYYMDYTNQLVLTGQINDVGAYTRTNIGESFRRGLELEFGYRPIKWLNWQANATYSQNQVVEFTEFVDDWDTGGQIEVVHNNTDLAFSPDIIAASDLTATVFEKKGNKDIAGHSLKLSFVTKYVGEQYIDNTSDDNARLDAYLVNDVRLNYVATNLLFSEINFTLIGFNVLDELYESNAWVYRYSLGGEFGLIDGYFPQAGRNYLAGVTVKF